MVKILVTIDPKDLKDKIEVCPLTSSNMREVLEKIVDKNDPLYEVLSTQLASYERGEVGKLSPIYAETLFYMMLGGICSAYEGKQEEDSYFDFVTIEGGNSLLCQKIKESLGTKVHLNMPLVKVEKTLKGLFILSFQNGEKVTGDIVVLAIPCSVYEDITFGENVIPHQKLEAISNVQYGKNAKVMIPFSEIPSKITSLVGAKIVAFFDSIERILTVYYRAETSLFSSETIQDAYNKAKPLIETAFGNQKVAPIYAKDKEGITYQGAIGYSWPNDPYAKGTYSYIASGQETILTSMQSSGAEICKSLFDPIDNALYFAGEHASILTEVSGTMEAACESGERVSRMILQNQKRTCLF